MTRSPDLKMEAITLRKKGYSYSEIMKRVPVAKSTISEWLHSVNLAKHQKHRITELQKQAQQKGAAAKKSQRIEKEHAIKARARKEVGQLISNPLWLTGLILYWGEGSKQKPWTTSVPVQFMNMDIRAHQLFIRWCLRHLEAKSRDLKFELYIHLTADIDQAKLYWSKKLSVPIDRIRVYIKRPNPNPKRKNTSDEYYGVLKTSIIKSTDINRRIAGWTDGVIEYLNR